MWTADYDGFDQQLNKRTIGFTNMTKGRPGLDLSYWIAETRFFAMGSINTVNYLSGYIKPAEVKHLSLWSKLRYFQAQ